MGVIDCGDDGLKGAGAVVRYKLPQNKKDKNMTPFVTWLENSPRFVQLIVRGMFWALIVLPLFALFDLIRIFAICLHDAGEWLCDIGFDSDYWCKAWWALRKRI